MLTSCTIFLSIILAIQAQMEPFIVGGSYTSIKNYPHSAFLSVSCRQSNQTKMNWICGASIINQYILLTAGHCVAECIVGTSISVNFGDSDRSKGIVRSASRFVVHEKYEKTTHYCDIALIMLSLPLKFNSQIGRVAIMRNPPYGETAFVAGWGNTEEAIRSNKLKRLDQKVWRHADCIQWLTSMPLGTICASSKELYHYAAPGDSGSALVVQDFIQIGLVSHKHPFIANNVIVYTDVGYFYNWITHNAKRLFCLQ